MFCFQNYSDGSINMNHPVYIIFHTHAKSNSCTRIPGYGSYLTCIHIIMSKKKNFKHFGPSFKKETRNKNKRACIECEKRVM